MLNAEFEWNQQSDFSIFHAALYEAYVGWAYPHHMSLNCEIKRWASTPTLPVCLTHPVRNYASRR
jgi:hypothetical protein